MNSKILLLAYCLAFTGSLEYIHQEKYTTQTKEHIMLQLYIYKSCPYCTKVITFLEKHNLMQHIEIVDAIEEQNRIQLQKISGRTQAPFLVDAEKYVAMPESNDIIVYLQQRFNV